MSANTELPQWVLDQRAKCISKTATQLDAQYVAGYYSGMDDAVRTLLNQVHISACLASVMIDGDTCISSSELKYVLNEMLGQNRRNAGARL